MDNNRKTENKAVTILKTENQSANILKDFQES